MEVLLCAPDLNCEAIDGCPGPLCLPSERHLHAEEEHGGPSSSAESTVPSSTPTAALLHASSDHVSERLAGASQQQGSYEQAPAGSKARAPKATRQRRMATAISSGRSHKKQCTASPTTAADAAAAVKFATAAAKAREEEVDDDDCDDELSGAAGPGPGERKGPVKHSTVEKQRRDRINTLIDLLAEQVPPVNSKYAGNQAAARRPKHAVLSDTLALLASIRAALKEQEETLAQLSAAVQVEQPPTARSGDVSSYGRVALLTEQDMPVAAAAQVKSPAVPRGRAAKVTKAARASAEAAMASRAAAAAAKIEQPEAGATASLDAVSNLPSALSPAGTLSQNPTSVLADALNPDVCVSEVSPGKFHVVVRCLHKPDLHGDLREGLSNLPVTLDQVLLSDATGCEDGFTHATLRISSAEGSIVTSDQLHLALYMSVCWGCTNMPQLQLDGGLQDALEALNPMDVCWEADGCGTMAQPDWGMDALHMAGLPHMHSSSSSASIDSWIDDM